MLLPMPSCSERLSVQFLHDFACAGCSRSDVNNCVGMHQNGMLEKRVLGGTQLRCPLNSAHHNLCSLQISPHRLENSYVQEQPPPPKLTAVAYRKCPLPRPMGGKSEGSEGRRAAISSAWHPVCGLGLHTMLRGRGPAGPTHIPCPALHLFKLSKPQTGWDACAPFFYAPAPQF